MRQLALALLIVFAGKFSAFGQTNSDFFSDFDTYNEDGKAILSSLEPKRGQIKLDHGIVLNVPDDFYFLGPKSSQIILVDAWKNPPGVAPLGMLFPGKSSPLDSDNWGIEITFENIGYVSDEDANNYNYDELLRDMKASTEESNADRVSQGFERVSLIGWASPPHYDDVHKRLHWAKELVFGDSESHTLNYNIRILGRKGVLQMNYIAGIDNLNEIKGSINQVMGIVEYSEGNRYADFVPSVDTAAAVGLGGLIAGKVLAKTSLLAAGLLLFKKFWFILLMPLFWLKNLFKREKGDV